MPGCEVSRWRYFRADNNARFHKKLCSSLGLHLKLLYSNFLSKQKKRSRGLTPAHQQSRTRRRLYIYIQRVEFEMSENRGVLQCVSCKSNMCIWYARSVANPRVQRTSSATAFLRNVSTSTVTIHVFYGHVVYVCYNIIIMPNRWIYMRDAHSSFNY